MVDLIFWRGLAPPPRLDLSDLLLLYCESCAAAALRCVLFSSNTNATVSFRYSTPTRGGTRTRPSPQPPHNARQGTHKPIRITIQ